MKGITIRTTTVQVWLFNQQLLSIIKDTYSTHVVHIDFLLVISISFELCYFIITARWYELKTCTNDVYFHELWAIRKGIPPCKFKIHCNEILPMPLFSFRTTKFQRYGYAVSPLFSLNVTPGNLIARSRQNTTRSRHNPPVLRTLFPFSV